jgi:uncharacterized protein
MNLLERLEHDLKDAMRARDDVRLRTIRSLIAALTEREIAERTEGEAVLSKEMEAQVVMKQVKQRRDSITQFEAAGREDLATREREEMIIIQRYMPRQVSDDEIRAVIHEIVVATGPRGMHDIGRVMGEAMSRLRGKADGYRVQQVVRDMLSNLSVVTR